MYRKEKKGNPEGFKKVKKMEKMEIWEKVNEEKISERLCYLFERWQDEKQYEDINDYLTNIQTLLPEAFEIIKQPFGVICEADDGYLFIGVKEEGDYLEIYAKDVEKRRKVKTVKLYNNNKGYYFNYGSNKIYLHDIIKSDSNKYIGTYSLCNVASIIVTDINDTEDKVSYYVSIV